MAAEPRYIREIPPSDRAVAAKLAEEWGYPRPIARDEVECGIWVRYGEKVLVWFVDPEAIASENAIAVHAVAAPGARGHVGDARGMLAMEVIAELLGATRLYSLIPDSGIGEGLPVSVMRRYLRMRGWSENEHGCYKDLGGV